MSSTEEFEPGDLVAVYADKDAEGHLYYKKIGVILGTVENPSSYMQFYTYRVFLGNRIAKIHQVWIKKVETDEAI
jgi:hypothetical protein